jgi:L-arabinose isomerase
VSGAPPLAAVPGPGLRGARAAPGRPRIGLLGIMQELYDEMLPGITEHQARYSREVAARLDAVAEVIPAAPARNREDIERALRELLALELDGIAIVMLTYGPALHTVRALGGARVPLLLANIQPERSVTEAWDMADLTYNQGIHGAQDQANALLRAGVPFSVITGDWRAPSFQAAFADWAAAARAACVLRRARIALLGYPMNGMGDIVCDPHALLRAIGPAVLSEDLGALAQRVREVPEAAVKELIAAHHERFAVAADLPRERHAHAARLELALRGLLCDGGYAGFSFHFASFGGDGRFEQLPLLAASDLMADGYAFAAEGDTTTAALMCAAQAMIGEAHFSEMYAMDWERDSVLISHMGEGNWRIARADRPVRLIDRELGIGGLDNPPTPVFQAAPGPATAAVLVALDGGRFRLVCGRGEVLDTPELPRMQMHHFHLRPALGMEPFMDEWLRLGAGHHFAINLGEHTRRWRRLAELLELEYVER